MRNWSCHQPLLPDLRLFGKPRVEGHRRVAVTLARDEDIESARAKARRAAAARGLDEAVTWSFISEGEAGLFGGAAHMLANPISADMSHMRPDLLAGLLQAAARNQARGFMDLALAEIGPAFHGGEPGEQHLQAAGLLVGASAARDPHGSRRPVDVFDVKADVEAVLAALGAPARVQISRKVAGWWHPGRSGSLKMGPKTVVALEAVFEERGLTLVGRTAFPGDAIPHGTALDAVDVDTVVLFAGDGTILPLASTAQPAVRCSTSLS